MHGRARNGMEGSGREVQVHSIIKYGIRRSSSSRGENIVVALLNNTRQAGGTMAHYPECRNSMGRDKEEKNASVSSGVRFARLCMTKHSNSLGLKMAPCRYKAGFLIPPGAFRPKIRQFRNEEKKKRSAARR